MIEDFFHLPPVLMTPVVHRELRIYQGIFAKKFETALMVYSGAWGKLIQKSKIPWHCPIKGTVSRNFLFQVFSWMIYPQAPENNSIKFLWKFVEIFACQGAPPVLTTPVTNCDTGSKFCHRYRWCCWYRWQICHQCQRYWRQICRRCRRHRWSITPSVSTTPAANNRNNIRLLTP